MTFVNLGISVLFSLCILVGCFCPSIQIIINQRRHISETDAGPYRLFCYLIFDGIEMFIKISEEQIRHKGKVDNRHCKANISVVRSFCICMVHTIHLKIS